MTVQGMHRRPCVHVAESCHVVFAADANQAMHSELGHSDRMHSRFQIPLPRDFQTASHKFVTPSLHEPSFTCWHPTL